MNKLWCVTGIAATLFLGSCSAYRVATFKSNEDSFERKSEKISIAVVGMPSNLAGPPGSKNDWLRIPGDAGNDIRKECGIPVEPGPGTSAPAFAFAGLAVMAAGILIDAGIAKLNEYTERKMKEFKHTYSARVNVGHFYLPKYNAGDQIAQRTRCILFQREVDISTDKTTTNVRTALTLVLQFKPLGDRAYVLTPIYLDLAYAGARTSAEGNSVDLDVAVGIAVVKPGARSTLVSELATQQNYSLRNIGVRGNKAERPSYAAKFETGTIIPALDVVTAATVVVAVTETGDGSEEFGQLRKDTDAYGKVLKDLGLDQLKALLGVQ
jgi:hypothetical protein